MSQSVYEEQGAGPIELADGVVVRPKMRVLCICCQQWVILGEYDSDAKPIALHPMPQCKLFVETDLLTYIRTLRQYYEGN
jgi:hypothetical protein